VGVEHDRAEIPGRAGGAGRGSGRARGSRAGCASSSTALAATGHQPRPGRPWFRPGRAPPGAWEALEQVIIGKAVDLLSGPGGLASFLRRRQLGVRLGGPSLPLDIGYSETIPAGIRHAVLLRDRHCQWAGRCFL
jgi:hypothetical protein